MSEGSPPLVVLHDLALLYFALAAGADGRLDRVEVDEVRERLRTWAPERSPAAGDHALREATLSFANGLSPEALETLATRLKGSLEPWRRERVLADLRAVAHVDDVLEAGERAFIARIEALWSEPPVS